MNRINDLDGIAAWQHQTFGLVPQSLVVCRGMKEFMEAGEALEAYLISNNNHYHRQNLGVEIADVWITLACAAQECGLDNGKWQRELNVVGLGTELDSPFSAYIKVGKHIELWQQMCIQAEYSDASFGYEFAFATYHALVDLGRACGFSFKQLLDIVEAKMEINRARQWSTVNGVSQHV